MPRGDRTGPLGWGPRTGRGLGYCAGFPVPGYAHVPAFHWASAPRWCGGRGYRHWYYATGLPGWIRFGYAGAPVWPLVKPYPSLEPEQEIDALRQQANWLRQHLETIEKRIAELQTKDQGE